MNLSKIERRAHPRTHAFVPTTMRFEACDEHIPVHMLDLSSGGAALLATESNSPPLGQYLYVRFDTPTNDGGAEGKPREELAVVVNVRRPEAGVARVGVRFIHPADLGLSPGGPRDLLLDHRKATKSKSGLGSDRWSFLKGDPNSIPGRTALLNASW